VLHSLKTFIEMHGKAVAVPVRYDLFDKPDELKQTLNSLEGVIFPGGFLSLRKRDEMPLLTQLYYKTATEILKYAIDHKLPLFGICQGYQLLCMLIVDLYEQETTEPSSK
jgi:gamma-glutamyl-gamma-aminobutyrate hydrolase PuuD